MHAACVYVLLVPEINKSAELNNFLASRCEGARVVISVFMTKVSILRRGKIL
jgi:hypothetical protein